MDSLKVEIKAIQKGVCELRSTGLRDNLIYLIIQKASGNVGGHYQSKAVPIKMVQAIVEGIEGLYDYAFSEDD